MSEEEAPKITEDLVAEITKAAVDAALAEVDCLLEPLIEKVEALKEGKQSGHNILPQRKGLTAIEREKAEAEEKGELPWWERL